MARKGRKSRGGHRPLNVLKHFAKRKASELKRLEALIEKREK